MTLIERLHRALENSHAQTPPLYAGDNRGTGNDRAVEADGPSIPAAVLIAVTNRLEPGVILTQRPQTMRRHAGQIAFPGGRIDPGDFGPIDAALREAEEEIALPRDAVTIIGTTDRYRTLTGYDVTPVLGVVPPDLTLRINRDEVDEVFEVPLSFLLEPANRVERIVDWQGRKRGYLEIMHEGRRIWGATAAIIANLSYRLDWS